MKLFLLLIISASMLIESFVNADGYLKSHTGCWRRCSISGQCDRYCKEDGGSYGYCFSFGCWCEGLPAKKAWRKGIDC
uniref:Putative depressant toxin Tx396 n=1 Tax=Buthus israelis TaxID=2899555 RepID=B8XH13_BUTIS|nr:putative depressant toxin Tx396 [Buthus occitanus israelis]